MTSLNISTFRGRGNTIATPLVTDWLALQQRALEPVRTAETAAEWAAMDNDARGRVKDVGGLIGGRVEGRRDRQHIIDRCLITFDLDKLKPGVMRTVLDALRDYEYIAHTTHSHTPQSTSARVYMPIKSPVPADVYPFLARYMANICGIDHLDSASFCPAQLMYWPSAGIDAEYLHWMNTGAWIDAQRILDENPNWTDVSTWPVRTNEHTQIRQSIGRVGDPRRKGGIVGAFCRAFDVPSAAEHFGLPYAFVDSRGTYTPGTTVNGVVLYEHNEFALYRMEQEFAEQHPRIALKCVIGDVKNTARVAEATGRAKIRLGFDCMGGSATDRIARSLAIGGTVVNYGALSGEACKIAPGSFVFRDVTMRGFWLAFWFRNSTPEQQRALFGEIAMLIATGALAASVQETFPLSRIKDAVAAAASGGRRGKILLVP